MRERMENFWIAFGALTFAETLEIAGLMRDALEATGDFDPNDVRDWSFLLNTARGIYFDEAEAA